MNPVRVLVADDHRPMLDTIVQMLSKDYEVVGAVEDGPSVVTAAARLDPDVLVLDIAMPGLSGIAAASRVKDSGSRAKVVFVTMHHDREFLREAMSLGAIGFVVKDRLAMDLLPAIRQVLAGESFASPSIRQR